MTRDSNSTSDVRPMAVVVIFDAWFLPGTPVPAFVSLAYILQPPALCIQENILLHSKLICMHEDLSLTLSARWGPINDDDDLN